VHDDDTPITSIEEDLDQSTEVDLVDKNEEAETRADDDDMDFTSDKEREMDMFIERQHKTTRGESVANN
jgi:hypothetical protein